MLSIKTVKNNGPTRRISYGYITALANSIESKRMITTIAYNVRINKNFCFNGRLLRSYLTLITKISLSLYLALDLNHNVYLCHIPKNPPQPIHYEKNLRELYYQSNSALAYQNVGFKLKLSLKRSIPSHRSKFLIHGTATYALSKTFR